MNKLLLLIFLCFLGLPVWSQDTIKMECIALPMGDSIIVKWIPGNVYTWKVGNDKGYQLTRTTARIKGRTLTAQQQEESQIIIGKFQILSREEWIATIDTTNQWDVLAAGTVYGDEVKLERTGEIDLQYFMDREADIQNKFAFNFFATNQNLPAAIHMGQAYIDKEVEVGKGYLYEVSIIGDSTIASHLVFDNQVTTFTPPMKVSSSGKDRAIWISWNHQYTEDQYFSYEIERSIDRVNFHQVNNAPVIQGGEHYVLSYLDSIPQNGITYYYRIRGKSPFGMYGPYSDVVSGEGKDIPEYIPPSINVIEESLPGEVNISWNFTNDLEPYIRGFKVYRAVDYDGPYEEINENLLSPQERNYLDRQPLGNSYYKIEVIYLTGESKRSASYLINLRDVTPPKIPSGIACSLDTINKIIHLEWEANIESDLLGYRLFMSGREDGDYFDVKDSIIHDNNYNHSIDPFQNGEGLYFRVTSVDNRYNRSAKSEYCRVELLDRKPPSPPLIRKVMMNDTSIVLEWASSPDEEVKYHIIERRPETSLDWNLLQKQEVEKGKIFNFEDQNLNNNLSYDYRIAALDKAGNRSVSKIRSGRLNENKRKQAIENIQLIYDKEEEKWFLQWEYVPPELLYRVIIYRSIDGSEYRTVKNLTGENLVKITQAISGEKARYTFEDRIISSDRIYSYKVKAIWKDGLSSALSKEVFTSVR